ncbi:MAG TPA: glycosyltransferase, partial [Bacteroidota bacterium]|nr:glycosyltransferase [Bacteroidota bacterium]
VNMPGWIWRTRVPADKFFKKAIYTVASIGTLKKLARRYHPDILVLYNLPQYVYTMFSHPPVVFDYADDYIAMLKHELRVSESHPFVRIGKAILRRLINQSVLVTCVSHVLEEKVRHPRVVLLANGAEELADGADDSAADADHRQPTVGYVGAFEYFIDIAMMLDAAERLPQYRFLFVGAGRDFAWTRAEVARRGLHNVTLTGAVPHHEAMQYVAHMDICLNLFTPGDVTEGASPIKVFEYLAAGRPVVSSPIPALTRIDPHGDALFYAETIDQVVAHIEAILANAVLCEAHAKRGLAIVNAGYTWTRLADAFVSEVKGALERQDISVALPR